MSLRPTSTQVPPPKDWQQFERNMRDLFEARWGSTATLHGRTGQKQHGVDIYGQPDGAGYHGIQCKGHDGTLGAAVTKEELEREIGKAATFEPRLAHFILATTAARDVKIQAAVRRLNGRELKPFTVEVLFWDDILAIYDQHEDVFKRHYPCGRAGLDPLHQLPAVPADFTGRAHELRELTGAIRAASVAQPAGAVLTGINGMGGVGKTALALRLAHDLGADYPDAHVFLDLRGTSETGLGTGPVPVEQALQHVLRAFLGLDAKLPDDLPSREAAFHGLLNDFVAKGKRALFLWDNARDAAQVLPLMPPPGCLMLVTSRRALTLPGMNTTRVDQLALPDATDLLRLIVRRAGRSLWDDQAERLATLCGRLPQALRLAGGALASRRDLTPDQLSARLSELDHRLQRLDEYKDDAGERSLRASMEMTEDLLPATTRALWHMLAVFPGDFEPSAAAAVWSEETVSRQDEEVKKTGEAAEAALSDLVVFNAVEFDERKRRYKLHDLVRSYVLNRLSHSSPPSDELTALRRFAGHYVALAVIAQQALMQPDGYGGGLSLFDAEWPNIQAAFSLAAPRAAEQPWANRAVIVLCTCCVTCLDLRLSGRERVQWQTAGLEAARRAADRAAEAGILGNLGLAHADLGNPRKAIEFHEQHLAIARELGDRAAEASALGNLGIACKNLGNPYQAAELYTQALVIDRETGNRRGEAAALGNLGVAYAQIGELGKAVELHQQRLAVARELGDRRGEARALGNLGNVQLQLGYPEKAIQFYEQNLAVAREIGDRRDEGKTLGSLGNAYLALGDALKATESYEQALAILREIGDRAGEAHVSWNLGAAYESQGDFARAVELKQRYAAHLREIAHADAEIRAAEVAELRGRIK